jgi:DNA-binding SARP family transcriptional activator
MDDILMPGVHMQVCVLGSIEIRSDTGTVLVPNGSKQRLLLAALVLHAPRVVSSDRLIDILWGVRLPADPAAALRTQVSRLRALLAEAGIDRRLRRGEVSGYGLDLAADEVDSGAFEALQRAARNAAAPAQGLALAEQALALWRDEPFCEVADVPHFRSEITRLRELGTATRERRVQCLLALGRTTEALSAVEALVIADPLREQSRALAMQAFYQAGRQPDALASFQEYRRLLSTELGLSPSPALRALEQEILQHATVESGGHRQARLHSRARPGCCRDRRTGWLSAGHSLRDERGWRAAGLRDGRHRTAAGEGGQLAQSPRVRLGESGLATSLPRACCTSHVHPLRRTRQRTVRP